MELKMVVLWHAPTSEQKQARRCGAWQSAGRETLTAGINPSKGHGHARGKHLHCFGRNPKTARMIVKEPDYS